MKRILLLFSVLTLVTPQMAIAKEATLLLKGWEGRLATIPMKSIDQCEEQGLVYMSSERIGINSYKGFECLESR